MPRIEGLASVALAVLAAAAIGCGEGDPEGSGAGDGGFDSERAFADLRAQVRFGPRPAGSEANRRMTAFLARHLREAGAEHVGIQRPHRNVVGVIPGTAPGAIVVGAHHDTKDAIPGFVGANDGASGVAVVLELARALGGGVEGPSVHLALFDAEEARGDRPFANDGARGSRQYVRLARTGGRQGSPPLRRIEAMVLLDLVGDCDLWIPREAGSDPRLYSAVAEAARELDGDRAPFEGETSALLDDHVPFLRAGIPAVDLIDFTYGPGPSPGGYWHTPEDTLDNVCPESLGAVGSAVLAALPAIGR